MQEFRCALADANLERFFGLSKFLLSLLLQRNVPDGAEDEDTVPALEGAEADFHGKLCAVPAPAEQLHAGAHHAQTGSFGKLFAMPQVVSPKAIGYEVFHGLAEKFFPLVAEKLFGLSVDQGDLAGSIH